MKEIVYSTIELVNNEKEIEELLWRFQSRLKSLQTNNDLVFYFTKKFFANATVLKVIDNNNKVIGFASFYNNNLNTYEAFLSMIAVSTECEGQGIGSKLISEVENLCINSGMKVIKLEVNSNNEKAISFYLKNGYEILKRDEKILMKKELNNK